MTYNTRKISEKVKNLREKFIISLSISIVLMICAIALIIFRRETNVIFASVACIAMLIFIIVRLFLNFHPKVLFSHELVGTNIKEHEFVTSDRRKSFAYRKRIVPYAKENYSGISGNVQRTKPPTNAIVYLRLSNGNVTYIDGLTNAQTDIYEIGDELTRYAGTKYPIITSRAAEKLPCPICGTVNRNTDERCIACGLEILK